LDKEKLLSHLHREEDRILGGSILDKIELVIKRKNEETTNFLDPYEREITINLCKQFYDINYLEDGGYKKAERQRINIFPEYLFVDHIDSPVSILKIEGNFDFCPVNHRDYLGAVMGLGIKRKMIGDLLVLDDFAQLVVGDEIKDFLLLKLKRVNEVPVSVSEIKRDDLVFPTDNAKVIKATVASMRLDAIASAGFGDSRNRISRKIKNEKIKLNWKPENNPAQTIELNDLISFKGRGRVKVVEENGHSHRGRIKLTLKRYT